MNYKLSTYADRVKGRACYILMKEGKVIHAKVTKFIGDNIKENALRCIVSGLSVARGNLTHDDLLIIEIQNSHLCSWLDGSVENKEYAEGLDMVMSQIESIDCRYRYLFNRKPIARQYMSGREVTKIETVGVNDLMAELEDGDEE